MCLREKIHIYNMVNVKYLHTIDVKYSLARLALSPSSDNSYLVYSDTLETGNVAVYDVHSLVPKTSIEAHKSPVVKLAINYYGTMMATCSCKV